jgi:hypothetical protein
MVVGEVVVSQHSSGSGKRIQINAKSTNFFRDNFLNPNPIARRKHVGSRHTAGAIPTKPKPHTP